MGTPALFFICVVVINSGVFISGFDLSRNFFSEHSASVLLNNHVKNLGGLLDLQVRTEGGLDAFRQRVRRQLSSYADQVRLVHNLDQTDSSTESTLPRTKRDTIRADKLSSAARRRRNYVVNPYDLSALDAGVTHVVKRAYQLQKPSFSHLNVTDLNSITFGSTTYIFAVETISNRTFTVVYKFVKNWDLEEVGRLETPGCKIVELMEVEGYYYILPAAYDPINEYSLEGGSSLYRVDFSKKFEAVKIQTINTEYARSITFWRSSGVDANDVILCVAPEKKLTSTGYRYKVDISCYRWQGGYFDLTYSIPAYNPKAVRLMSIASHSYMCVANYQDDSGSSTIYSTIYRYSHKKGNYVPFQKIQTYGAMDCQYFRFDSQEQIKEHYLAIANFGQVDETGRVNYNVKSYIFKFGVGRFILHQSLVTFGAFQILPIQDGPKFLLIIGEMYRLSIYQHNGWNFVKTREIELPERNLAHQFRMRPLLSDNHTHYTIASPTLPEESGVYGLEYEARNDYVTMSNDLEEWCTEAVKNVDSINLNQLAIEASQVPNSTEPEIIIKSSLIFAADLRANSIFTQSLEYNGAHFNAERSKTIAKQQYRLQALESRTGALKSHLNNVISLSGDQTIKTHVEFSQLDILNQTTEISTAELNVDYLNTVDIWKLVSKLVFLDQKYSLDLVEIDVLQAINEIQTEKLNGKSITEVALKSTPEIQSFLEENTFNKYVSALAGMEVVGLVNGVKPSNVLTVKSNQTFDEIKVTYADVNNLVANFVNGIEIQKLLDTSVLKTGTNEIHAVKIFNDIISSHSIQTDKFLSNISVKDIFEQAVYLSNITSSTFTGTPVFESITAHQLESANKLINNEYDLSKDFVPIHNSSFSADTVNIYNDASIRYLNVKNSFNEIPVLNETLDVVLKYSPSSPRTTQHLYGHNLHRIHLDSSSSLDGTINGVDIKSWSQTKVIELENSVISGEVFVKDIRFSPLGLTAEAFEQGANNVLTILERSMPLNSADFQCRPIFESVLVKNNTQVYTINSASPTHDWISRGREVADSYSDESQNIIIGGKKHFSGDITLLQSSSSANGLYIPTILPTEDNDEPIQLIEVFTHFENALLDGVDQGISGNFNINDTLKVQHLQTKSKRGEEITLDRVNFANILLTVPDQSIQVKCVIEQVLNIESLLYVRGNIETNSINGRDLGALVSSTLRTESGATQVIRGDLHFSDELYINNNVYMEGKLGNYEINQLFGNIVLNRSKQQTDGENIIEGSVTFKKATNISSLMFTKSMNNITPNQWGSQWLTRRGDQEILTPLHFANSLSVNQAQVQNDTVSNINIVQLNREALRRNQANGPIYLGSMSFESDVVVEGSICSPSFNGFDVSNDLLRKNSPSVQKLTGTKTFKGDWTVQGDLNAPHLLNTNFWDILRFSSLETKSTEDLVIYGHCYAEKEPAIISPSDSTISSTVNNATWTNLLNSVWFDNENAVVKGPIQFKTVTLNAGGTTTGVVDGVDIISLERDYLSLTRNQNWNGTFEFDSNVVFEQGIQTYATEIHNGTINGLDIPKFSRAALIDGVDQSVNSKLIFKHLIAPNVKLSGNTNGIDFCKDIVTLNGAGGNYVTALKNIQNVFADTLKLEQGARISQVNLDMWRELALSTKGNFILNGERTLEVADFTDLEVNGLVDGKVVSYDTVMTLQGRQTGKGDLVVENNDNYVTSFSRIYTGGNVNGENIGHYFNNFVLVNDTDDQPLYIYGNKTIQGNTHTAWLKTEGPYEQHGINVVEFLKNYSADTYVNQNYNVALEDKYEKISNWTSGLIEVAADRAVLVKCFDEQGKLNLANVVWLKVLHGLKEQPMISLVVRTENDGETAYWYTYNLATDSYEMYRNARGRMRGMIVDQTEIIRKGQYYLFASVSSINSEEVTSSFPVYPSSVEFHLNDQKHKLSQGVTLILREDRVGAPDLNVFQVIYGDKFGNLLSFYLITESGSRRDCVLYTILDQRNYRASVYCFNSLDFPGQDDNAIHLFQEIPLVVPPQLTSIIIESKTFVIMSGGDDVNRLKLSHGVVEVWAHEQGDGLLVKEDSFPIVNVINMDSVLAPNTNPFLAIVSGKLPNTKHSGLVYVYKYSFSKKRFVKYQTIHEENPIMVKFHRIVPSDDIFLHILTENSHGNVNVYSFKGVSGWVKEFSFTSPGAQIIETSAFYYQGEYRAHILASSSTDVNVIDIKFNGVPFIHRKELS